MFLSPGLSGGWEEDSPVLSGFPHQLHLPSSPRTKAPTKTPERACWDKVWGSQVSPKRVGGPHQEAHAPAGPGLLPPQPLSSQASPHSLAPRPCTLGPAWASGRPSSPAGGLQGWAGADAGALRGHPGDHTPWSQASHTRVCVCACVCARVCECVCACIC